MDAIVYAAKSTEDKHGSIPTQLEDGRKLCERDGLTVVDEYQDESKSAYHGDRGNGLAQAREHAERIAADKGECALVVQHTDRLARGDAVQAQHLIEIVLWARKVGVTIRSKQDDSTCENLIMAVVMGERNHEDSKRKSASTKAGKLRRAQKGLPSGGPAPYGYGYTRVGEDRVLSPISHEASIVLRMFEEFKAGTSQLGIAKNLNADGIPTKGNTALWRQGTVRRILVNPLYKGEIDVNGERIKSQVEPTVSAELWDACEQRREALARTKGSGRGRPPTSAFLFIKGMLRCGKCGSAMVPRTDSARHDAYRCDGRSQFGTEFCDQSQVQRKLIDEAVFAYFASEFDFENTQSTLVDQSERKLTEVRALHEQANKEAQKAQERLLRVRRDYQDGNLVIDDWNEQREQLAEELDAANAALERMTKREATEKKLHAEFSAEDALTEHISRLRAVVSGEINDTQTIAEARAVIMKLFESFRLVPSNLKLAKSGAIRRGIGSRANVSVIVPELRTGIACFPRDPEKLWEKWTDDNYSNVSMSEYLFAPIPL